MLLILPLLLLKLLFDQLPVVRNILVSRVQLQRLIIGLERLWQLSNLCQGIAFVVERIGAVNAIERRNGLLIFPRSVVGSRLPLPVFKLPGGGTGITLLEHSRGLLIGARPKLLPLKRCGILRVGQQYKKHQQQIAAAKGQRSKRQNQQQQPRPLLLPLIGGQRRLLFSSVALPVLQGRQ